MSSRRKKGPLPSLFIVFIPTIIFQTTVPYTKSLYFLIFIYPVCTQQIVPQVKSGSKTPSKAYFFDNPNRYNSDDDLTRTVSTTDMRQ